MKQLDLLITNDDGIQAEGLLRLATAVAQFGRVWIAAPQGQCSGMSQKLTIRGQLSVEDAAVSAPVQGAWAVGGTPADCVKAALHALVPCRPDVVLSGINKGYNAGFDIAYSGTIGAAMEAVLNGIPAIALSGCADSGADTIDAFLPSVLETLLCDLPKPGSIWNVNFPGCSAGQCKGIFYGRRPAGCSFYENTYTREGEVLRIGLSIPGPEACEPGSDIRAVLDNYISIGELHSPLIPLPTTTSSN